MKKENMLPRPIEPRPGEESVWDYPRPPRLEASKKLIEVVFNEVVLARSTRGFRLTVPANGHSIPFQRHEVEDYLS